MFNFYKFSLNLFNRMKIRNLSSSNQGKFQAPMMSSLWCYFTFSRLFDKKNYIRGTKNYGDKPKLFTRLSISFPLVMILEIANYGDKSKKSRLRRPCKGQTWNQYSPVITATDLLVFTANQKQFWLAFDFFYQCARLAWFLDNVAWKETFYIMAR